VPTYDATVQAYIHILCARVGKHFFVEPSPGRLPNLPLPPLLRVEEAVPPFAATGGLEKILRFEIDDFRSRLT
jgi:hypothetical protein